MPPFQLLTLYKHAAQSRPLSFQDSAQSCPVPGSSHQLLRSSPMVKIQAYDHRLVVSCPLYFLVVLAPEEPELGIDNTVHWSTSDELSTDNMLAAE